MLICLSDLFNLFTRFSAGPVTDAGNVASEGIRVGKGNGNGNGYGLGL